MWHVTYSSEKKKTQVRELNLFSKRIIYSVFKNIESLRFRFKIQCGARFYTWVLNGL